MITNSFSITHAHTFKFTHATCSPFFHLPLSFSHLHTKMSIKCPSRVRNCETLENTSLKMYFYFYYFFFSTLIQINFLSVARIAIITTVAATAVPCFTKKCNEIRDRKKRLCFFSRMRWLDDVYLLPFSLFCKYHNSYHIMKIHTSRNKIDYFMKIIRLCFWL